MAAEPDAYLGFFVQGFALLAQDDFTGAQAAFEAGIEGNSHNAPLNADIRMVIKKMQDVASGGESEGGRVVVNVTEQPSTESEEHILLANYQQYGLPH